MSDYFDSPEAVSRLIHAAGRWQRTPWMPNSESVGVGVACHNLPRALYVETGALPASFPRLVGDPNGTRHRKDSAMIPFVDRRSEFRKLRLGLDRLRAGDLIGLRIYHCVDHLGVMLSDREFVHVLMHKRTDIDRVDVPPWSQHVEAAWRVVA